MTGVRVSFNPLTHDGLYRGVSARILQANSNPAWLSFAKKNK
jgi:hypothetical protein